MALELMVDRCDAPIARLILAHGAGAPMDSPFMQTMAEHCCKSGIEVVRFEFQYMAQRRYGGGKRPPDKQEKLLEAWQSAVDQYAADTTPLFIGGKSMGGRMATLWAASTERNACRGIICYGYPFHPPGKPEKLRIKHLPSLPQPTLIIQGERDPMGKRAEVEGYYLGANVHCHWLPACNHDLAPLKRSGLATEQALVDAAESACAFVRQQLGSPVDQLQCSVAPTRRRISHSAN